jgi:hypothetical protein
MINAFCKRLDGVILFQNGEAFTITYHGRMQYVINLKRHVLRKGQACGVDLQYYLDISVIPVINKQKP